MGGNNSSGTNTCPKNNTCTGVSIEHLFLHALNPAVVGIHNVNSQDLSYVNDVNLSNFGTVGLQVDTGAVNSGPYANLNYVGYPCSSSGSGCVPECVVLSAQTRGLHGITCIGDKNAAVAQHAAIEVNAGNTNVENVHIEGFWDGIEIGNNKSLIAGNVSITNVVGSVSSGNGFVTNTVHICGPSTLNLNGDACPSPGTVSDVVLSGISNWNGSSTAAVEDDASGSVVGFTTQTGVGYVAWYALGEPLGGAYTRFATTPTAQGTSGNFHTTNIPTWQVGSDPPTGTACPSGALYSNLGGSSTLYVCSGGTAWKSVF
jgi:hypothetical protein